MTENNTNQNQNELSNQEKISLENQIKILFALKEVFEILDDLWYCFFRNYFLKKIETPRAPSIICIVPVVIPFPAFKA